VCGLYLRYKLDNLFKFFFLLNSILFFFLLKTSALSQMPQGASVPALGLSNKAVYDDEKADTVDAAEKTKSSSLADDLYKEVYFNKIDLNSKLRLSSFLFFNHW
jgi:hypothetical protein